MKKLNRKGFTLVELLAVIVILAIVVGIALTTVLPTLKKSRQNAFDLTANTAADYFEKQYSLYLIGENTYEFTTDNLTKTNNMTDNDYQAAGLKADNYQSGTGTWEINEETARACVILYPSTDGQYYDATGPAKSDGCGD